MNKYVNSGVLFTGIVITCLFLVAFIVIVGGIVCIKDDAYTFTNYLGDLTQVYKLLLGAVAGAFGNAYVAKRNGTNGGTPK